MNLVFFFLLATCCNALSYLRGLQTFPKLDEALPPIKDFSKLFPVFDFDPNSCHPAAAISRTGEQNVGLAIGGTVTTGCRHDSFMDTSNLYHRFACETVSGVDYCGHMFGLYFEKDQWGYLVGGHTNDWEHVLLWTRDGTVTHAAYSAHGDYFTESAAGLDKQDGKIKFVYHKDGVQTHAIRFAKKGEVAENEYGTFVTMTVVSWYQMVGDGVSNADLRHKLNTYNYGSAHLDMKDSVFISKMNENKPSEYPSFATVLFW